jgi:hypothetical protein
MGLESGADSHVMFELVKKSSMNTDNDMVRHESQPK